MYTCIYRERDTDKKENYRTKVQLRNITQCVVVLWYNKIYTVCLRVISVRNTCFCDCVLRNLRPSSSISHRGTLSRAIQLTDNLLPWPIRFESFVFPRRT